MQDTSRVPTGIPHEQETPAPVTTTMRLLFANVVDNEVRARRVDGSVDATLESKVTVMVAVLPQNSDGSVT